MSHSADNKVCCSHMRVVTSHAVAVPWSPPRVTMLSEEEEALAMLNLSASLKVCVCDGGWGGVKMGGGGGGGKYHA